MSGNFISWQKRMRSNGSIATDAFPVGMEFKEELHPRAPKGAGGGRFRISPKTIEKQDMIDPASGSSAQMPPSQAECSALQALASRIRPLARLINGRIGNQAAIQASSRYPALQAFDGKIAHKHNDHLLKSQNQDVAAAAQTLLGIADAIDAAKANGFTNSVGMVPDDSDLPVPGTGSSSYPHSQFSPNPVHSIPVAPKTVVHGGCGGIKPFDTPSHYATYLNGVNANVPAATNPNAWKAEADAMTPAQAVQNLESLSFNGLKAIVKGGYRDTFYKSDPDEVELWSGWRPNSRLSNDTVRCAAVCFADLAKRFPDMPWKSNLELRCGTKPGTGGQSTHTSDGRRHTVLFNCDYNNIWPSTGLGNGVHNYGHADARFPFDVLRHEMGHALISGHLPNGKRMISKWHDAMTKAYGNPATALFDFARQNVSRYAVTQKGNGPSMAECLSECFSLATSPDYKPGYLPEPVEQFIFTEMLGVKPTD